MFWGFKATERPSLATIPGVLDPFGLARRGLLILNRPRRVAEMSVSPAQNFWKPPPVPAVATVTLTPGSTARKRSAAASLKGATVDDPSTVTVPLTPPPGTATTGTAGLILATTPTHQ